MWSILTGRNNIYYKEQFFEADCKCDGFEFLGGMKYLLFLFRGERSVFTLGSQFSAVDHIVLGKLFKRPRNIISLYALHTWITRRPVIRTRPGLFWNIYRDPLLNVGMSTGM